MKSGLQMTFQYLAFRGRDQPMRQPLQMSSPFVMSCVCTPKIWSRIRTFARWSRFTTVILYLYETICQELPMIFHLLFCEHYQWFLSTCSPCSEVVFELVRRASYYSSMKAKLIFALLGRPTWVWPSMDRYRMYFSCTSTLHPTMHQKHTKHGRCCMQTNQLPTTSHVELENNSIDNQILQ